MMAGELAATNPPRFITLSSIIRQESFLTFLLFHTHHPSIKEKGYLDLEDDGEERESSVPLVSLCESTK